MQDFSPVEYTTGELGKFYIGDSYIILRTQVPSSIIIIITIITIIHNNNNNNNTYNNAANMKGNNRNLNISNFAR